MISSREARSISLVKEDIRELNALISKNKELIEVYPDDPGLRLQLGSFEDRLKELLHEFGEAQKQKGRDVYDIAFEGDAVGTDSIAIQLLGTALTHYQEIVTSIVDKTARGDVHRGKIPKEISRRSQLNVAMNAAGSFRVIIVGGSEYFDEPPYRVAMKTLNDLIDCGADKEKIRDMKKFVGARTISKYKGLLKTLKNNRSSIKLYDELGKEHVASHKISLGEAERVYDVLDEVEKLPDEIVVVNGTLRDLSLTKGEFGVVLDNTQTYTGKIADSVSEERVTSFFNKRCQATITISTEYNEWSDEEKRVVELTSIIEPPVTQTPEEKK